MCGSQPITCTDWTTYANVGEIQNKIIFSQPYLVALVLIQVIQEIECNRFC